MAKSIFKIVPASLFVLVLVSTVLFTTTIIDALSPTLGVNVDPTNSQGGNATVAQLASLGGSWVRLEFKDNGQGTSFNPATWSTYDSALRAYSAAGMKVLLIIDYESAQQVPWNQPAEGWNSYIQTFAAKAEVIAARYGTGNYFADTKNSLAFEVWNEPDLSQTHVPEIAYAQLLYRTWQSVKIKAGSPAAIVMGGLASGNPGYVANVRANSPNRVLACDSIALHPYGQAPSASWPGNGWGFGTVGELLDNYRDVESAIPFVISEVGTNDVNVQGEFPAKFFAAVQGKVLMTIWFCFSDGMVSPFGLLETNGAKKQSWFSFQQYANDAQQK